MKRTTTNAAKTAALVGIMAATIECAKLAMASIPNVEVITLLIAVYSYVFGFVGVLASLVFVMIEPLVWGFGTWIVSYLIYWPLVGTVFLTLGKTKVKNRIAPTLFALLLTAFFGILTTLVDIGLFSGYFDNFAYRFIVYYSRGITFYLAQLITNLILFPLLFKPLCALLMKIKKRTLGI